MNRKMISLMLAILFVSACSYTPDRRSWTDIALPAQSVQLEIVDKAGMNKNEIETTREVLAEALKGLRITVDPAAERKLVVEVVGYNEQSTFLSALRWGIEAMGVPPVAHFTTNNFDLRARLIRKDGSTVEFTKLAEISEAARELRHMQENMARRVAYFVFTADVLDEMNRPAGNVVSSR